MDFSLHDRILTAHCPNTGSMATCFEEESTVLVSIPDNRKRKLPFTLELVSYRNSWIFVNTSRVNSLFFYYLTRNVENPVFRKYFSYRYVKTEPGFRNTKWDFLLFNEEHKELLQKENITFSNPKMLSHSRNFPPAIVEVKNTTYFHVEKNSLQFPDAPTKRGYQQIQNMIPFLKKGFRCFAVFLLSRQEGEYFSPAREIDENFYKILKQFHSEGGIILPLRITVLVEILQDVTVNIPEVKTQTYRVQLAIEETVPFRWD